MRISLIENGLDLDKKFERADVSETATHSRAMRLRDKAQPDFWCENCQAQLSNNAYSAVFSVRLVLVLYIIFVF